MNVKNKEFCDYLIVCSGEYIEDEDLELIIDCDIDFKPYYELVKEFENCMEDLVYEFGYLNKKLSVDNYNKIIKITKEAIKKQEKLNGKKESMEIRKRLYCIGDELNWCKDIVHDWEKILKVKTDSSHLRVDGKTYKLKREYIDDSGLSIIKCSLYKDKNIGLILFEEGVTSVFELNNDKDRDKILKYLKKLNYDYDLAIVCQKVAYDDTDGLDKYLLGNIKSMRELD